MLGMLIFSKFGKGHPYVGRALWSQKGALVSSCSWNSLKSRLTGVCTKPLDICYYFAAF